jgi:type I restriction enzyme S subunit
VFFAAIVGIDIVEGFCMMSGWIDTELGKLCAFENGDRGTNYPSRSVRTSEGIPFINAGHLTEDGLDYSTMDYIPRERFDLLGGGKIRSGDILFCLRGSLGKFASVGELNEGAIASSLVILRPGQHLLPSFLLLYFDSALCRSMIEQYGNGAAQPNLSSGSLKQFLIPLPPLPEQQRIVTLLDEAFEGIATAKANAERNLQNARAIFEGYLESELRCKKWTWTTLGELCEGVEYGTSAKSASEGRVPVLRMGNIQNGQFEWASLVYTDDDDEITKYLLKHNDVLFNRTNSPELVGKTAIYKSEMPAIFAGYLIRIRRNENLLDGDFLNYFLNSQIALDYGKTVVISSVNQANINGTKLKGYPIPAPSLQDQKIIVKKLDDLRDETQRLESIYRQKLVALDDLKKSLLHRAFTGDL